MKTTAGGTEAHNSKFTVGQIREEADGLPALIDARTLAGLAGVTERHVQRMASAGKLPCVRVGNRYRFNTVTILKTLGLCEVVPNER